MDKAQAASCPVAYQPIADFRPGGSILSPNGRQGSLPGSLKKFLAPGGVEDCSAPRYVSN